MPCFGDHQRVGKAKYMLPLGLAQTQVQTIQKGPQCRRMLYNELEQGDILSGVRCRLALLAYSDILLCSIWAIHKIRQSPKIYLTAFVPEPGDLVTLHNVREAQTAQQAQGEKPSWYPDGRWFPHPSPLPEGEGREHTIVEQPSSEGIGATHQSA